MNAELETALAAFEACPCARTAMDLEVTAGEHEMDDLITEELMWHYLDRCHVFTVRH